MAQANNTYTPATYTYLVWQDGDPVQVARRIEAKSAYAARRIRAKELGLAGVSTLQARITDE